VLRLTDLQNDQRSLRVGLVEEVGIITSAYVTIRPSKVVHPKFLNYFLKHMDFRKDFYALGAGVRQSLKFDELRSVKVPVPTLTEQKVIVDYLDRETARIDALIEKKQRMMGLASELVGSKIESVLNSFVANCPRPSLAYVLSAQITDGPHETPEFVESGVPFLSVDNIQNSQIDFEHTRFISSEENARFSRKSKPIFGDVLLTKAASVGKVALVATDVEFNIWSPIAILRPNRERLTPEYLWWLFRSPRIQMQLQLYATSSTQQNISMRDLSSIRLDVPSLDVQGVCVSQLNKVDAWSRNLLEKMVKDKELLIERRQALITAAVTGELEIPGVAA
jgi:type I restriction enzyme S subunit